jgi:uncharacterized protein (DUF952 family)
VILLLTNSFDLEDGFLTASNLEEVKGYLASTYPGKYGEVLPHIKNCSLESELDTVRCGGGRQPLHMLPRDLGELPAGQETREQRFTHTFPRGGGGGSCQESYSL